jgi:hypothetical protein
VLDLDGVRIDERSPAGEEVNILVVEVGRHLEPVIANDRLLLREEIPQPRPWLHLKVKAVQLSSPKACQIQRGLAKRFERDAGTRYGTAEDRASLDERYPLAEIGSLRGALLAGRTCSDHDQIIFHRHALASGPRLKISTGRGRRPST